MVVSLADVTLLFADEFDDMVSFLTGDELAPWAGWAPGLSGGGGL